MAEFSDLLGKVVEVFSLSTSLHNGYARGKLTRMDSSFVELREGDDWQMISIPTITLMRRYKVPDD